MLHHSSIYSCVVYIFICIMCVCAPTPSASEAFECSRSRARLWKLEAVVCAVKADAHARAVALMVCITGGEIAFPVAVHARRVRVNVHRQPAHTYTQQTHTHTMPRTRRCNEKRKYAACIRARVLACVFVCGNEQRIWSKIKCAHMASSCAMRVFAREVLARIGAIFKWVR